MAKLCKNAFRILNFMGKMYKKIIEFKHLGTTDNKNPTFYIFLSNTKGKGKRKIFFINSLKPVQHLSIHLVQPVVDRTVDIFLSVSKRQRNRSSSRNHSHPSSSHARTLKTLKGYHLQKILHHYSLYKDDFMSITTGSR